MKQGARAREGRFVLAFLFGRAGCCGGSQQTQPCPPMGMSALHHRLLPSRIGSSLLLDVWSSGEPGAGERGRVEG